MHIYFYLNTKKKRVSLKRIPKNWIFYVLARYYDVCRRFFRNIGTYLPEHTALNIAEKVNFNLEVNENW